VAERLDTLTLKSPVRRLAVPDVPIPYSRPLERHVIPQVDGIAAAAREMVAGG
jgi:pyruvate dehydrogenase E1 component beta subunit